MAYQGTDMIPNSVKRMAAKLANDPATVSSEVIVDAEGGVTRREWDNRIRGTVRSILVRLSGLDDFTDDAPLGAGGLDFDSLDRLTVAMELEEAFNIDIPDADVDDPALGTPAGIVAYVERRLVE